MCFTNEATLAARRARKGASKLMVGKKGSRSRRPTMRNRACVDPTSESVAEQLTAFRQLGEEIEALTREEGGAAKIQLVDEFGSVVLEEEIEDAAAMNADV